MTESHEDHQWLVSDSAAQTIQSVQLELESGGDSLGLLKRLRRKISPQRSALVIELAKLRMRARKKFRHADRMFFTRRGLEMATDQQIARLKAARYREFPKIADVCCSIGGDLIGLATENPTAKIVGIDCDQVAVLYANSNVLAHGLANAKAIANEFAQVDLSRFSALHVDPDRRQRGRTTQPNLFSPALPEILDRVETDFSIGVKIAPASRVEDDIGQRGERQWIGHSRACHQQMLWLGTLAKAPGIRTATLIDRDGEPFEFSALREQIDLQPETTDSPGRFISEPHSVLLAAGLANVHASEHGLKRFSPDVVYTTSDHAIDDRLVSQFRILEIVPAKVEAVASTLVRLEVGKLEVKKRGIQSDFADQFRSLKLAGTNQGVLLLTRVRRKRIAIIAERIS